VAEHESPAADAPGAPGSSGSLKSRIIERLRGSRASASVFDWRAGRVTTTPGAPPMGGSLAALQPAAVLVPLIERESGLTVLLTQRASHLKNHAGQVSFPGGRIERSDRDALAAALREAREEIGLEARCVTPIGYLPDHPVTLYRVTPVVAFIDPGFVVTLDRSEVADTFEVPLAFALDPANYRCVRRRLGHIEIDAYELPFGPHLIWGGTARMLVTFRELLLGPAP
jgi:8-oxo-dGTP pyrophosphatase MutT (NUDIX family)